VTNKEFVLANCPEAMLAHVRDHEFEIVRPTKKGENGHQGWKRHRILGRGTNPRRAWASASVHQEMPRHMPDSQSDRRAE
jgi:hypothetical protein